MGQITSCGCARNDRITLDFVSCDPIIPGTATRRDSTHQIKLLKLLCVNIEYFVGVCDDFTSTKYLEMSRKSLGGLRAHRSEKIEMKWKVAESE